MSVEAKRILVIDDEEIIHISLKKMLEHRGFEISSVYRAREGLDRISNESHDLILTDLMMPHMDGVQLLGKLRMQGNTTPVVMITGYPTIKTALQALRLGAVDYVTKPFTRLELISALKRALRIDIRSITEPHGLVETSGLAPGMVVYLPNHAWAELEPGGTFRIGLEQTFIQAVGAISSLTVLGSISEVTQGKIGLHVVNEMGEEHGVTMPLSGQVIEVNEGSIDSLGDLESETWLLRVLPSEPDDELPALLLRESRAESTS